MKYMKSLLKFPRDNCVLFQILKDEGKLANCVISVNKTVADVIEELKSLAMVLLIVTATVNRFP